MTETIFSAWNIAAVVVTVVVLVASMASLRPKPDERIVELPADAVGAKRPTAHPTTDDGERTPAQRVDGSRVITTALGSALVTYLVTYFTQEGLALTLDIVNWTFLTAILLLVRSPAELAGLVVNAARNVGDILLQVPLYAGILGIMTASGLIGVFSDFFVELATPGTLGVWAFVSGGLLNLFVPSGGGQFAVQAPIFVEAASQLDVDPAVVIMGIAYGDQWTNMIQPFWALPLLAIAGLGIRDILGYTTIALRVTGVVFGGTLLLVGAG